MKKYAPIHVGTRWATEHTWGVMVEGIGRPAAELLCVGCTQAQAEGMAAKLNERQETTAPLKMVAPVVAVMLAAVLFSGCTLGPLKGGHASTVSKSTQGIEQSVVQGDNPAAASRQDQETVRTKTYTVPAGSRLVESHVTADAGGALVTNASSLLISAPMSVVEHEETRAKTELGAAQKDTARELSAKLASLKSIVWVGVLVFLFGLATMFYPPLRLIVGSITTSAAITVGGLALIVLPTVIVGNEMLIMGGVAAAVGLWFLAHRHGQLRGLVDAAEATVVTPPDNSGKVGGV
ncbi:MAG: hypothetical protein WCS42_08890 [Verrucomicrobiota bacterium]